MHQIKKGTVFNVQLEELNRLLVGKTSCLGVVRMERNSPDSLNNVKAIYGCANSIITQVESLTPIGLGI